MKIRVRPHGGVHGTWFLVQEKRWWGWYTLCDYIDSYDYAMALKSIIEDQR